MRSLALAVFGASSVAAADLWLAVGYGGRRMISTDGRNWEITAEWAQPGGDDSNNLISALYAQNQFVVTGGGGGGRTAAGHILVSPDGRNWTETLQAPGRISPVLFGPGRYVAGATGYPSGHLLWSADARTWHDGAKIAARGYTHFRGGAFGNGVFVFVGNGGGNGGTTWAIVSPDGGKIVSERNDLPGFGRIVFGGGRFIMMTGRGDGGLIASEDGRVWVPVALPGGANVTWLVDCGDAVLAGSARGAFRSTNSRDWTAVATPVRNGVIWSDGQRFIATSWPGKMSFSPDGRTWLPGNPLSANGINRVVHVGPAPDRLPR